LNSPQHRSFLTGLAGTTTSPWIIAKLAHQTLRHHLLGRGLEIDPIESNSANASVWNLFAANLLSPEDELSEPGSCRS
jgi:hypothetical protein